MKLNDFVDNVYFINLDRRKDRLIHIEKEFKRINIKAERFSGIDASKLNISGGKQTIGAIGALRSHTGVLKHALKHKYKTICVFEDDIIFCDDFEERLEKFVQDVPKDWDIMYLGSHFHGCKEPVLVGNNIWKVTESFGCFAMILNNRNKIFEKIIDISKKEEKPIDDYIHDNIHKIYNCYVFLPIFVRTLDTVSDIADREDSFAYDAVDKFFQAKLDENFQNPFVKVVENKVNTNNTINTEAPKTEIPYELLLHQRTSTKYTCEEYQRSSQHFLIYYNGKLIFDSSTSDRSNLSFRDNHFTLYGKVFLYQNMLIKNK